MEIKVTRVKVYDGKTFFDANVNGIDLYGMRLEMGKYGYFIGFPSKQGKDGKWYNHYFFKPENMKELVEQIEALK